MGRQVKQSNLASVARWYFHGRGQVLLYWIVKRDLATEDHVGQDCRREGFGEGADLEDSVAIERQTRNTARTVGQDARVAIAVNNSGYDTFDHAAINTTPEYGKNRTVA